MDPNGNTGTSSGSLRAKISLKGGYSQLSMACPFYGMKAEQPTPNALLGSDDLIQYFDFGGAYNRYCGPKKLNESLSSFLHQICGTSKLNFKKDESVRTLRNLIEKPPITGKEILPLSASAMLGFKLAPGKVPENLQYFDSTDSTFNPSTSMSMDTSVPSTSTYNEFGRNFNDSEEEKNKHRKKIKRSLDDMEDNVKKTKRHRGEEREKEKKREKKKEKKEKKEKKKKKNLEEDSKKRKDVSMASPFF